MTTAAWGCLWHGKRTFLDVVVGQSATVFQLLAGEDQTLLVRGDTYNKCAQLKYFSVKS
jgi:hypothetical protein